MKSRMEVPGRFHFYVPRFDKEGSVFAAVCLFVLVEVHSSCGGFHMASLSKTQPDAFCRGLLPQGQAQQDDKPICIAMCCVLSRWKCCLRM